MVLKAECFLSSCIKVKSLLYAASPNNYLSQISLQRCERLLQLSSVVHTAAILAAKQRHTGSGRDCLGMAYRFFLPVSNPLVSGSITSGERLLCPFMDSRKGILQRVEKSNFSFLFVLERFLHVCSVKKVVRKGNFSEP